MAIDPNKQAAEESTRKLDELLEKYNELVGVDEKEKALQAANNIQDFFMAEIQKTNALINQTSAPAELNSNSSEKSAK